jgi:DNA-binding NarL/FixJ family response regulator
MNIDAITVAIVADHAIVRFGLSEFLNKCKNIRLVGEAADGKTAVDMVANSSPNIILVDIEMALMEPYRLLDTLTKQKNAPKLIMLCLRNMDSLLISAIRKGARGFIMKDSDPKELETVIHEVAVHNLYLDNSISYRHLSSLIAKTNKTCNDPWHMFNDKELQILQMISEELTSVEIAKKLFLSVRTIEDVRQQMMRRVGAKNVTGLVVYGFRQGLINFANN